MSVYAAFRMDVVQKLPPYGVVLVMSSKLSHVLTEYVAYLDSLAYLLTCVWKINLNHSCVLAQIHMHVLYCLYITITERKMYKYNICLIVYLVL